MYSFPISPEKFTMLLNKSVKYYYTNTNTFIPYKEVVYKKVVFD